MDNKKISIIVPIYNVEEFLNRCIESLVNQTYKNLEIILVDDESPDNSPAICDKWAAADSRIVVIHKKNEGVAVARNTGLSQATGDYIGFVDGDDYCFKTMYEHLMHNAAEYDADISMCSYYESADEVDDVENSSCKAEPVSYDTAMKNVCMGEYMYGVLWNKIYKAELVKGIVMPALKCSQDLPYNYFAFKKAQKIVLSDEMLYFYRVRQTSTTKSKFGYGALDAVKAREIILKNEKNDEFEPYATQSYINSCFTALSGMISNQSCLDKYDEVRDKILQYKKLILSSDLYCKRDKVKVTVLSVSPKLYNKFILNK